MRIPTMTAPYHVLIIGAGNMGARYDHPDSPDVLSHAHAFTRSQHFHLLGFVDSDLGLAKEAAILWGGQAFPDVASAMSECRVDVACVATPDASHTEILMALAEYPLKLVFCEKPLATRLADARAIVDTYAQKGLSLAVNYTRRYVPEIQALKYAIQKGDYGAYLTGTGYYGKGIIHNGSHLLDLFHFLVGSARPSFVLKEIEDYTQADPSLLAALSTIDNRPFIIQPIDSRKLTVFELDLIFERGRIRITNLARETELQVVQEDRQYAGYQTLGTTERIQNNLAHALSFAVENLYAHLSRGEALRCTAQDALETLTVCEGLLALKSLSSQPL